VRRTANKQLPANRSNFDAIRPQIEHVALRRIGIATRQLKKHPKAFIAKLAAGISRYGFLIPMVVDEYYGVVSGHARLEAAKLIGLDQVPVIRIDHLTPEQLRMFAIYENKISLESEVDEVALNLEFEELRISSPELDLTDSGFAIAEIDALAGRIRSSEMDDLDYAIEEPPAGPAVTQVGDLWDCGRHRLLCGDSTDPEGIARLLNGVRVHQSISDPPFNLPTRAFSSSGRHRNFQNAAGELDEAQFVAFLARYLEAAIPHLVPGALVYSFMDGKHIGQLIEAGTTSSLAYKQLLVWVKSAAGGGGMGSFYRSAHELVAVFKHGEAPHQNNIALGRWGRNRSNVLHYPGVMGTAGGRRALKLHPTVKNVALVADLMLDASSPGDNILDSFGGSGTTLIAAEMVERTGFLCELSPNYVDVAVERYNRLGGEQARLAATGQTFAEVRAERCPDAPKGAA
jgi:DNA modification methylase